MEYKHVPVMLEEAMRYLGLHEGEIAIDCTLGGGGYTFELAKIVGDKGRVIAIDADERAIKNAERIMQNAKLNNIEIIHDNFKNLGKIIKAKGIKKNVSGVVFDLGLSSDQLQDRTRGFSFKLDAPLDMQVTSSKEQIVRNQTNTDKNANNKTEEIVNKWKVEDLERIIREYGEERYAGRIAFEINKTRKQKSIKTTSDLADIIKRAVPNNYEQGRIHSATRTFQALRIASNNELENLKKALPVALNSLKIGGRIVVVSYHSLEDRIVKNFFKQEAKNCLCPPQTPTCVCGHKAEVKILTKRPFTPTEEEIKNNPRARSAKLRAVEKI